MSRKVVKLEIVSQGSPPDVDTDFHTVGRQKVIEYVINKYGADNVSSIITPGPFKSKNSWKSMCTIQGIPQSVANGISGLLPDSTSDETILTTLEAKDFEEKVEEVLDKLNYKAMSSSAIISLLKETAHFEDRMRETGVHPCGMLISTEPITNTLPVEIREDGLPIAQWVYTDAEELGLIKMDFLGLDTVDLIDNACKMVEYTTGTKPNMAELISGPLDDKKTLKLFQRGDTFGIFQFGGEGVRKLLRAVKPTMFEDIAAITAIYRPGPIGIGLDKDYAERKNNLDKRIPFHPKFKGTKIEEILEGDYGALIYQESVMRIASECAGFSAEKTDKLRKAIGKKDPVLMESLGTDFQAGLIANDYDKVAVKELWDGIKKFGAYSFNKSHSISYALNSFQSAYLKAHYQQEFMATLLNMKKGAKEFGLYVHETNRMGIVLSPPNINESGLTMLPSKINKNAIVYGLSGLKRISDSTIEYIVEERERNGKYISLVNFIERTGKIVKPSMVQSLIHAGCFDELEPTRKSSALAIADIFKNLAKQKKRTELSLFEFGGVDVPQDREVFNRDNHEEYDWIEKCLKEYDIVGTFLICNPLEHFEEKKFYDNQERYYDFNGFILENKLKRGFGNNKYHAVKIFDGEKEFTLTFDTRKKDGSFLQEGHLYNFKCIKEPTYTYKNKETGETEQKYKSVKSITEIPIDKDGKKITIINIEFPIPIALMHKIDEMVAQTSKEAQRGTETVAKNGTIRVLFQDNEELVHKDYYDINYSSSLGLELRKLIAN